MKDNLIVTASEVGAMLNAEGAFKSKYQLWHEKAGLAEPENFDNIPHIKRGLDWEPVIIKSTADDYGMMILPNRFGEAVEWGGGEVENFNGQNRIIKPPLGATPDAWIEGIADKNLYPENDNPILHKYFDSHGPGVLEVKCRFFKRRWEESGILKPPENYILQVLTQLIVTGRRWGAIATNDGFMPTPKVSIIIADSDDNKKEIDRIQTEAFLFLESIKNGEPPPLDSNYPKDVFNWDKGIDREGEIFTENLDFINLINQLMKFRLIKKELPSRIAKIEADLILMAGQNHRVSFRGGEARFFDGKIKIILDKK